MTRQRRLVYAIAAVFAMAATSLLHASNIAIHLHRQGTAADAKAVGTLTARNVADSGRSLEFALPAASIALPPGDWFLSAHLAGQWSEPRLVSVRDDAQSTDLNTFPLARLTARITTPMGKVPHELQAYFHRVSLVDVSAPAEGIVPCAIKKGVATCDLPAGEFDFTFRIPGYVSRYRWNASLTQQKPFDAGTLQFVAGSTLSGRVEIPQQRDARLDRVTVVVKPAAVAGANEALRHRHDAARLTTHPTRRGFFALDLPPGQFTLQASCDDLISEEMTFDISAGHEALLRQPLQLQPQRSVTVHVHPNLDPWSKPWTIEIARTDLTGVLLSERSLHTASDGTCHFNNVLPGSHRVTVARSGNQSWASESLYVDGDSSIDINVRAIRVTGTIRLGSKPLAATAMVRSTGSGASGFLRSKADGTFLAALPAPEHDTWDEIEVRAAPSLKRTLQNVHVQRRDDGTAELNLDLPARFITGTVVDEIGRPAAPALVDLLLPDGTLQQVESSDGSFVISALEPGQHRLRATTLDRESIDLQTVALSDDADAMAEVVLPIAPVGHLRGVIRALDGPVLGAGLYAVRMGDHTRPVMVSPVDPEGHFDLRFPAATSEVAVAINAPGFAFRLARIPLSADDQALAVEQNGGSLSVDVPAVQAGLRPYLMHNGAALPATAVAYVAGVPFFGNLPKRARFQIPSMEPGDYSLCWLADEGSMGAPPCINGFLAPHGTLILVDDSPKSDTR
jgi:hypothetical protein